MCHTLFFFIICSNSTSTFDPRAANTALSAASALNVDMEYRVQEVRPGIDVLCSRADDAENKL